MIECYFDLEIFDKNLDKNVNFTPLSFKLESAYVSEDSKKIKKKITKKYKFDKKKYRFFF